MLVLLFFGGMLLLLGAAFSGGFWLGRMTAELDNVHLDELDG